eukprot:c1277_g1_i1.p1 GENE.c1277_g1_i1~~c1277_g1_i1.p1  ORF type:complete len:307 (-),score=63.61 c1277_g1_i1:228-1109(-)
MEHKQLIHNAKLSDIKSITPTICSLSPSMKIADAHQFMVSHNIISAPVTEDGRIRDVVELLDICVYTLGALALLDGQKHANPQQRDVFNDTLEQLLVTKTRTTHQVLPISSTVADVMRALVTTHRVVVVDERGEINDIITQSDFAKYFARHASSLGSLGHQSLRTVLITSSVVLKSVESVTTHTTSAEAFKKLAQLGVQGLGVVDDQGRIVAEASASRMKFFGNSDELLSGLNAPINDYVKSFDVLRVDSNIQFGQLLHDIVQKKTHRAFIVDDQGKPTDVFTLSDLMAVFSS